MDKPSAGPQLTSGHRDDPGTILFRGAVLIAEGGADVGSVADVMVQGETIADVGNNLPDAAMSVDASGMILLPGMVDTHNHVWETMFRGRMSASWGDDYFHEIKPYAEVLEPDDVYASVVAGDVEALNNGVTTVMDYCHCVRTPEHADAAIAAHRDTGIRVVYGYDLHERIHRYTDRLASHDGRMADAERIHQQLAAQGQGLVSLALCLSEFRPGDLALTREELALGRALAVPSVFHNDGPGELTALARDDLLSADVLPIHGNYNTEDDLIALGRCSGFLSTQPQTEMFSGRRSMSTIARALDHGVRLAVGVDVPALTNLGVLQEMRTLYLLQRYLDGVAEREVGRVPVARRRSIPHLSPTDVVDIGTVNGAVALGLGDKVGRVQPGYAADLVLVKFAPFGLSERGPASHVVMNTSYADVDTVMVAGRFMKLHGELVALDLGRLASDRIAARNRVESAVASVSPQQLALKSVYAWGGLKGGGVVVS
ncbi:MAG: amidohydrolase family protein [Chloroflexi bacterium]|nr:amidohydrolase family protein [Chloroflexota bacterium]